MFKWAPVIAALDPVNPKQSDAMSPRWDAHKEFGSGQSVATRMLTPWEEYAQVLLLSNEFLFVD
jgi:hypothetical protein